MSLNRQALEPRDSDAVTTTTTTSTNPQVCGAFSFLLPRKRTPALTLVHSNDEHELDDSNNGVSEARADAATAGLNSEDAAESTLCREYYIYPSTRKSEAASSSTCMGSSSRKARYIDTTIDDDECGVADDEIKSPHRSSSWLSFFSSSTAIQSSTNEKSSTSYQRRPTMIEYTPDELLLSDCQATPESDLSSVHHGRPIWIVTTAALPWMTGTAINPILRAAHLALYTIRRSPPLVQQQQQQPDNALASPSRVPRSLDTSLAAIDESTVCSTSDTIDMNQHNTVHLVLPWLQSSDDRVAVYGTEWENVDCNYQEAYIQDWMKQNVPDYNILQTQDRGIQIHWYPARYHAALGSIFALGDICSRLPIMPTVSASSSSLDEQEEYEADDPLRSAICILEEPEHLNYYRGGHWRTRFAHVIGIIHTNYCEYAKHSLLAAPLVGAVSAWMVQAYCDKVIQLSATLPSYAPEKEVVCNVHGVRSEFFVASRSNAEATPAIPSTSTNDDGPPQIYFLGKLLWAKGLDKLLQLQHVWKHQTHSFFPMDIYGSGADQEEIEQAFAGHASVRAAMGTTSNGSFRNCRSYSELASSYWWGNNSNGSASDGAASDAAVIVPLPVTFRGRIDHAVVDQNRSRCYKIFVNPSISEVLCTVTAEAVAMGNKFVIVPHHPSNEFFEQFPNCLLYHDDTEFVSNLQFALAHEPVPLSAEHAALLTWEGATERFIQASRISLREAARRDRLRVRDQRLADWHIKMGQGTTGDVLRQFLGGGPVAKQSLYDNVDEHEEEPSTLIVPDLSRASSASGSPVVVDSKRRVSNGDTIGRDPSVAPITI